MNVDILIDSYIAKGVNAVNEALKTVDNHTRIVLLQDIECRGFFVKWHFDDNDDRDFGIVMAGPDDL